MRHCMAHEKWSPLLFLMFPNSDELTIYLLFFQRDCRTEVLVSVKTSGYNPGAGICSIVSLANIFPQGTKGGLQWLPSHVLASRPQFIGPESDLCLALSLAPTFRPG